MHIIYLAGNNLNNKIWIETVKSNFDSFSDGQILYYSHWETGEKNLNFEIESQKLAELVKDKAEYFVFAKSIGSVLALKGVFDGTFSPKKMVICGLPYRAGKKEFDEIDDYLKTLAVPTMFIQNELDPVYGFDELTQTLKNNSPSYYHLIKNAGNNTHDYEDFEQLSKIISEFFIK